MRDSGGVLNEVRQPRVIGDASVVARSRQLGRSCGIRHDTLRIDPVNRAAGRAAEGHCMPIADFLSRLRAVRGS